MAEPTISLTFLELYTAVHEFLGWETSAAHTASEKLCVNDGYRRFLSGVFHDTSFSGRHVPRIHDWSFLSPADTINLWPTVTGTATGTYPASVGTITATAASFYPSMVGRSIAFTVTGVSYTIIGYTSSTVVTVSTDPSAEVAAAFTITADGLYGLPEDFAYMIDWPSYPSSDGYPRLQPTSVRQIREWQAGAGESTGVPHHVSVLPRAFATATGQRWDLLVYPTPGALYDAMPYRYRVGFAELSGATDYPVGSLLHSGTIKAWAVAYAEENYGDRSGVRRRRAEEMMLASVLLDLKNNPPETGGQNGGSWARKNYRQTSSLAVTYTTP